MVSIFCAKTMALYPRLDVLNRIMEIGLVPIFYHPDPDIAHQIVSACAAGGAGVVEFTNRGDGAWTVFNALLEQRRSSRTNVVLGAGSIVDAPTAAFYVNSGADFIVGPTFNPAIAELCNRRKVAYMPGCATLTEISTAEAAGVELVKLFPGHVLGPKFVQAVHGPQPWTRLIVTGGVSVDEASIREWFAAGVSAVGISSGLIQPEWVMAGNYEKITETVALVTGWIERIRTRGEK
jgi:2-dehydro-3-deoxyphosphogluconate aldolase / (4S)-4-hydroxy-2-oxoglutarate aldolase